MVVLVVVDTALTADSCTASHLRNMPRLMVEVVADNLAHSSDTDVVAAVERIEGSIVCSLVNASRAKPLLLRSQNRQAPQ